ncbi:hypothetical protein [Sphingomonas bacterium]|uniref:hypothetical protein n=1 Tax=Sphingomonas bacterium TaxID=1895847 RepID=UPI00261A8F7A|nr:hypothetical protein [Sphingomonas bacterium]MDB5678990.1 hypothetical protein [Sphingomonas bacterium]
MPKPRAYTHWTADTCTAFFMALRFHGAATRAAAEIGRSVASAYKRRDRDAGFAARWDDMLDQWRAANLAGTDDDARAAVALDEARAMPNRERFDGLTPLRQRAFLRALSETGAYAEACRRVRLSATAVRRMRARYPSFAAACDRALGLSLATLEQAAAERGVSGIEEPVWHAGRVVGTRRRYSDGLLKDLLAAQRKRIAGEAAAAAAATPEPKLKPWQRPRTLDEVRDSILEKLSNLDRYDLERRAGEAERLLAEGKIP